MEQKEVKQKLIEIVVDKLGCEDCEVTEETRLRDLGADSLDEIEMLIDVEKEFHIYIKDEEALKVVTFADAVELVERKINE